jgi:uncharacterized protein (TIGR02246 family)
MRQVRNVVLAAAAVSLLTGCIPLPQTIYDQPPPPPIAVGPATERQIEGALQRYAARIALMDAPGVAAMYTPDGVWERQSGTLYGRDAIRQAVASTGGVRVLSNEMIMRNISYNGPALIQVGEFRQSLRLANGKTANIEGRFEATWVQAPYGEWLIHRMVTRAGK